MPPLIGAVEVPVGIQRTRDVPGAPDPDGEDADQDRSRPDALRGPEVLEPAPWRPTHIPTRNHAIARPRTAAMWWSVAMPVSRIMATLIHVMANPIQLASRSHRRALTLARFCSRRAKPRPGTMRTSGTSHADHPTPQNNSAAVMPHRPVVVASSPPPRRA